MKDILCAIKFIKIVNMFHPCHEFAIKPLTL